MALFFLVGYTLGRMSANYGVYDGDIKSSIVDNSKKKQQKNNITIDDTKYVVDIKTDDIEKKYHSLGDKKTSTDNISSSVDKLKNLKR